MLSFDLVRPVASPPGPQGEGYSFSAPVHVPSRAASLRWCSVGCGIPNVMVHPSVGTGRSLRSPRLDQVGLVLGAGAEASEGAIEPSGGDHLRVLAGQALGQDELGAPQVDAE